MTNYIIPGDAGINTCGLTVLRCAPSLSLAKIRQPDGTFDDYQNPRTFDAAEVSIPDLTALHDLLAEIAAESRICVVRGALVAGDRAIGIRRLRYPDRDTGDPATLRDVPRSWLALDLDSLPLPPDIDVRDVAACACAVIPKLSGEFWGRACIAQATAGHTFKPGARLRLWYWLGRPATCREVKTWLTRAAMPVDMSLFQPQAVVYTAAPIFGYDDADPLPQRLVRVPGEPCVPVPPAFALLPPPPPPRPADGAAGDAVPPMDLRRLGGILRRVRWAEKGERHNVLLWGSCRLGEATERGEMTEAEAVEWLTHTMAYYGLDAAEHDAAMVTIRDGLAMGRESYVSEFEVAS